MDLLDEEIEREAASTSRQSNHHDTEDSDFMHREAVEVEILMNHKVRISRTRRMNWYLDYHDCYIRLADSDLTGKKPFQIGGAVIKDGDKLEPNEEFKISSTTFCLFFSKYYKMSFVLDFSPTCFAADGVGSILYTNMMPSVEKVLKELVNQFTFSNSATTHKAEIYVSLFAYSPYVHFRRPSLLVHGFRVTDTTLKEFLDIAHSNAQSYLHDLLKYMNPINFQKERTQSRISYDFGKTIRPKGLPRGVKPFEPKTVENEADNDDDEVTPINDKVAIDFRLIQMLRLGMIGLYAAPETSHPGIVIVTDGILYIPNHEVIQNIALNLRTNCIPLNFIQITSEDPGTMPGMIPSNDLLSFLSQVSYGNHIRHKDLLAYNAPDNFINKYQKLMLAWSCQRGTYEMEPPLPNYANDPGRIRKQISKVKSNFYQLFHVRIREGYFLKSLTVAKKGAKDYITTVLTLPWTFDSKIDYQITAAYDDCDERVQDVQRIVSIETNYVPPEPIKNPNDSALTAAMFLSESEKFAIKILSFSIVSDHYEIERIPIHRYPSVYGFTKASYPFPTLLIKLLENSRFNAFWEPLVLADNAALHRCSHTLSMRFTIQFIENQKPSCNYWPEYENGEDLDPTHFPSKKIILNTLFEYFKETTTFCLVSQYSYVKIVREGSKPPEYCYLIKIFSDSTMLTIKVIFVGDCSLDVRNKTVGKIRNDLMKIDKIKGILHPVSTGVEAKMIKYHKLPETFNDLQPLAMPSTSEIWETRQKIHQHALVRFLRPRRLIYKIEKEFDDSRFGEITIEGMNLIVRRRILEGYRIGFIENGIVHMIKEIPSDNYCIPPRLEQLIIFPPHKESIKLRGAPVQQLREQLAAVGKVLQIQKLKKDGVVGEDEDGGGAEHVPPIDVEGNGGGGQDSGDTATAEHQLEGIKYEKENIPIEIVEAGDDVPRISEGDTITEKSRESDKVVEIATSEASGKHEKADKKEKRKRKKHKKRGAKDATNETSSKDGEVKDEKLKEVEVKKEEKVLEKLPHKHAEEIYEDKGCFIISEYWGEPDSYTSYNEENMERLQHSFEDRSMLSALITFRSMQCELDRAPGIGTALIGGEAYSMHVDECPPVNIAKFVNFHSHLYNLVKMCKCGERLLVLMPTLKYVHSDPHSINRLGRILDSFNHEMRNYMPQCFDFEDTNGAWEALATGLEHVLEEVDQNELYEAEQISLKDYDTDVERVMDENEDSTGTGYSTPAGLMSPASLSLPTNLGQRDTCAVTDLMSKMDDETLRKHVLGSYNKMGIFGSGESLNVPKSPSEQRSTSVPLPQEDDDQAEFLPSKNKKTSPSILQPFSAPMLLTTKPSASDITEKEFKPKKTKNKLKKKQNSNLHNSTLSLTSFDRCSERSRRRAREDVANDQAPLAFYVYYKRRDPKTIIVVMVPATCRAVLKITNKLVPRLPVLSFMIEEDRMFDIFRHSLSIPKEFKKTNVENFCARSALAHLNWQVNAKLSESERETPSPASLFSFETIEGVDPTFTDLNDFSVNIMHDLIFSRSYAQAAYHCLGTNVHVPQNVLEEVLEERCTQTSVPFGSIREVLRVTCTHLSSYLQSKRVSRYKRHQMPNISSTSSSESEIEVQQVNEYQLMNPFCYSEAENDEICKLEQTEFRLAFENVLRLHKFFKVPAFADYYFYWPNGDNTVQLFNSGGTWNEHLDDGTTTVTLNGGGGNDSNKNNDDSSDDSAVTLVSQDGGSDENDELDYDIQPLFLQFYVSVPRSDGDVYSYPVDFIPNCLQDVIGRCDVNFFTSDEKKALNEFNVDVEMYVLTVPSVDVLERPDERLRRTTEETIDWMLSNKPVPVDDINLPPREREIVLELKKGIHHMLKTEQILILSRYFDSQKSYKNICHVVEFVEGEASRNDEHTRVQTAQSDMLFVTKPEEGLRRLCERLEGSMISYCKIRCVRDEKVGFNRPIMFYCCSVEDFDTFCLEHKGAAVDLVKFDFKPKKKQRVATSEGFEDSEEDTTEDLTESSTLINQEIGGIEDDDSLGEDEVFDFNLTLKDSTNHLDEKVKRKQIVHDFWLIAKVESDPMRIKSFFFQRPNGVHDGLFKQFTDLLIEQVKIVNQTLLLEELHETKECSPYLIDDEKLNSSLTPSKELTPLSEYASKFAIQPNAINDDNDDLESQVGSSTALLSQDSNIEDEPVTYMYSPGYFFCPLVWYRWYSINPRLRQGCPDLGLMSLRSGLENIAIRNRKNVYVFKESTGNIFYMYLFSAADVVTKVIPDTSESWKNEVNENIKDNILFAVFGIHPPSDEITVQYANVLQKKLDMKLLDELQKAILKNPQLRLRQTDINFIQQNSSHPASTIIYSLPTISKDYVASIFTYLQQHLSSYYIKPQYPEDDPKVTFRPYPFDGEEPLSSEYEGVMYLVNKPKAEGQRSTGLGCFEMRLVDKKGTLARRDGGFPPGKLNANSFSLLYPGFSGSERLQKAARYHELTKCVQIDSFELQGSSINSNHFMEFFIWQVGDIGMEELQTRLRIFCLQALADLIVEFGLMSQPFLEPVSLPQSPSNISRPSSLMRQTAIDQKTHLRKRGSTAAAAEVHFTHPPLTPINLQIPQSPGGPISPSLMVVVPPTIMAIDSPSKNTTMMLHSPRPGATGNKFGFDANSQYFTAWTDVAAMGANRVTVKDTPVIAKDPKVTQFATEIPKFPEGQSEYLRLDFIQATTSFFYHMERESRAYSDIMQSFQKFRFIMDCDHMAQTILRVIYAKFYHSLKSCGDSVVVLKQMLASDGSKRLQTIKDVESLMGNSVTQDKGHVIDFNEDYSDVDFAILVYNKKHMDEMIHQSMEADSPPAIELEHLSKTPHDSHFHFGPSLSPCFVPRRRLFFVTIRGEAISLFLYNVNPETTLKVKEIVERAVFWNNARSRLLREIGLHKMQITHLSTLKSTEPKVNLYQLLTWRDPELLITHDYPPDNIKSTDISKIPKRFARMFLKLYRYSDPAYVLKQNTQAKFDDQTAQMLSMREQIKEIHSDFQLFNLYHTLFLNPPQHHHKHRRASEEFKMTMDEDVLIRLLTRCEEAHYVQTPLLLFPEWRKKVAAIRAIGTDYGSVGKRKHSAPAKNPMKKQSMSLEPKMKPRSKTVNVSMLPTLSRSTSGEEPCSLKIQYMLAQEYTNYLVKHLGAKRIYIQAASLETRSTYTLEYTQNTTVSPVVWLYLAYAGGFLLIHLSFIEPYFCLRVLFWNRGQLFEDQTIQDLRSFIKEKNQIVSKCHLHSFTYDFHLRMVKTYLVGGTQLLFNRGYNTNAFLIDFLQYYSCRPPSARNCIYEENCLFDNLKVPGTSVWENFLDKESKYGWKVVRLKTLEKDTNDEFMLVLEVPKSIFEQEYEGVRVITNVLKATNSKEPKLYIRYYVIMVSRDNNDNPMLDYLYTIHEPSMVSGEFKRLPAELFPDLELEDEFPLEFDVAYDSDARQSSGSNSDKSQQRNKNRQSVASLASGNNSNDRLSDFDTSFRGYLSPCPSPMSQTLVDFSLMTPLAASGNFDAIELRNKLTSQAMIQKVPPRGHRKNASISSEFRNQGGIPPEQVTYVHYFNNLQKKLQIELEEFARASKVELEKLVAQADKECHVEMLWRKLLSLNSINYRKQQTSILTQIGNRLESNQDATTLLKHITSTDLNQQQWHTFISIINTINMEKEEPKLVQIFNGVNYMKLFKFLLLHYEGDKRCRYFDFDDSKNLVITNPNCLNSATLFQYKVAEKKIELLMIFKEHDFRGQQSALFGMNAIHKQFEEIMHCLSSYLWSDLLVRRPYPQRR